VPPRERDAAGRPLNARPRDGLGRPLPRGAAGVPRVPEDLVLPPAESLAEAQRLLDAGMPFHAHEVLEGTWKAADVVERDLWQGLAQLAVGLTHLLRGNRTGAGSLLRRGRARLSPYAAQSPHGIDVAGLLGWADGLLAELADVSAPGDAPTPTVPRLRVEAGPGARAGSGQEPGMSSETPRQPDGQPDHEIEEVAADSTVPPRPEEEVAEAARSDGPPPG
jgi:uncharacterized protein